MSGLADLRRALSETRKADPSPRDGSSLMGAGIRDDGFGQVGSEAGCQHS